MMVQVFRSLTKFFYRLRKRTKAVGKLRIGKFNALYSSLRSHVTEESLYEHQVMT